MADDQLARTFVELADTLVDDFDVVEFLHMLVDRCVELLDVSAAGLLLGDSSDRLRVMASSAENIHLLECSSCKTTTGLAWSVTAPARRSATPTWAWPPTGGRCSLPRPPSPGFAPCTRCRCGCARRSSGRQRSR